MELVVIIIGVVGLITIACFGLKSLKPMVSPELKKDIEKVNGQLHEISLYLDGLPTTKNKQKRALFKKGISLMAKCKYAEAIDPFKESLSLELDGSEKSALLLLIGSCLYLRFNWDDQALGRYKEALDEAEQIKDEQGQAAALGNLGLVYKAKRERSTAIEFHEKSLRIKEKIGDDHGMAQTYYNLGDVYHFDDNWAKAIEFYEKSFKIDEQMGDEHRMAETYYQIGSVYLINGELTRAIEFYEKALEVQEKIGDKHLIAYTCDALGSAYDYKDEWMKAIEFYEKSLTYKEKIEDKHGVAHTKREIADLYKNRGMKKEARKILVEILQLFEKQEDLHDTLAVVTTKKDLEDLEKEQPWDRSADGAD
jgi:tetratricopeptide (TPR) repeat protein